jgi:hypothetical protein
MRKYLAVAGVGLLLLAGCTSGSDDTSSAKSDTSTTSPAATGPAPGVTADTIKVGITYVDLEAIKDLTDIDHGSYEDAYRAVIDDINAKGGINGRKIEPVFAAVNPIGTDPAEAACVKLTQDEKVFAAIGFFSSDAPLCYVETHDTAVIGGNMTAARLDRAKAPWFTTESGQDLQSDVIRTFAEKGMLDGKLAVFANQLDADLLKDGVLPLLAEQGIKPVASAVLDAPPDDVAAQNQQTGVIAERFKSQGADKVLVIGDGGVTWAGGLEHGTYRPQLLFTGSNSISSFYKDPARDVSLLKDAVVGDLYGPAQAIYDEPAMQQCIGVQKKAGVKFIRPDDQKPGDPGQYVSSFSACRNLALFKAIAEKAGKDLNYGTFEAAGEGLGSIHIPGDPRAFHYGGGSSRDGDPKVTIFHWNADNRDFTAE